MRCATVITIESYGDDSALTLFLRATSNDDNRRAFSMEPTG
jgi:hypothetical protein